MEQQLIERDFIVKKAQKNTAQAQNRMKKVYDSKHREREFQVGDYVYLKLQAYRQTSVSRRLLQKLASKFYSPFKVLQRIGAVAYKLELPPESRIHPVFHVSILKKHLGNHVTVQQQLPVEGPEDPPHPLAILEQRTKGRSKEVLVHWAGCSPADATWEKLEFLRQQYPTFPLEDKSVS